MQAYVGVSWGLVKDIIDLKRRYDLLGGDTYQAFIDAWHEEKMPYIICGLQSLGETIEFTEETYHVARAYLNPPATYKERVFGMYLLNAFYHCQHLKDEVKIMVMLEEWNHLLELQKQFLENGDDKAAFLFCLLRISNAFVASAATRAYGLGKNFRKYFNLLNGHYKYSLAIYPNAQTVLESDVISNFDKLRIEAMALRKKISNPCSSVFSEDLTDVKKALQEVIYDMKVSDVCSRFNIQNSVESTVCEETVDIGERRQKIKKAAFVTQRMSPRHRRDSSGRSHTQSSSQESEPDVLTSDSDYSPSKPKPKTKPTMNPKKKKKTGKRGRPRKVK